jgi:hypothetical protein
MSLQIGHADQVMKNICLSFALCDMDINNVFKRKWRKRDLGHSLTLMQYRSMVSRERKRAGPTVDRDLDGPHTERYHDLFIITFS